MYIFGQKIILCQKSGTVGKEGTAEYKEIMDYFFGDDILNISRSYQQHNSYYTSAVHTHVGTYLMCLRDLFGIDLMGMYNCFAHEIEYDLHLDGNNYELVGNEFYKVLKVPIKFNKTYTIALDAPTGVIMKPMLRTLSGFIE